MADPPGGALAIVVSPFLADAARTIFSKTVTTLRLIAGAALFTRQRTALGRLELLLGELFDSRHKAAVAAGCEHHGFALGARSPRTTDAVHVVFGTKRYVVVDHNRKFGNVQTSSGHIGRHQHFYLALLESFQGGHALFLRLVSVNGVGRNANTRKRACKTTACDLGVHKDDDLLDRAPVFAVTLKDIDENIGFSES